MRGKEREKEKERKIEIKNDINVLNFTNLHKINQKPEKNKIETLTHLLLKSYHSLTHIKVTRTN